jgi:hypothetical protein
MAKMIRANPETFYMQVAEIGDPVKIATAIRDGLAESKTPLTVAASNAPPPAIDLDTAQLDQIIGVKGHANGAYTSSACLGAIRSRRTVWL